MMAGLKPEWEEGRKKRGSLEEQLWRSGRAVT